MERGLSELLERPVDLDIPKKIRVLTLWRHSGTASVRMR